MATCCDRTPCREKIREGLDVYFETSSYLCGAFDFRINDVEADYYDFVEMEDEDPGSAPEYGCGNMTARGILAQEHVLKRYNISLNDYNEIVRLLETELHVGQCSMCA